MPVSRKFQVSFKAMKPRNDLTGFFMKVVFMYWLTNNFFNLAQSVALQNKGFHGAVGLPLLSELGKLRSKKASEPVHVDNSDLEILDVNAILKAALTQATQDREEEALKLLEFLVKKYPYEAEAYNVYEMLHIKKQQWPKAIEYYSLAAAKATVDSQRITASMGAGISLYNQGQRQEAISVMKPLIGSSRTCGSSEIPAGTYYSGEETQKEEAISVLELAVKWDTSVEVYIKQLENDLGNR